MFTTTKLTYFSPPADGSRAFAHINADPATGERPKNWNEDIRVAQIEDIRGKEVEYSLDVSGFQYYRHPAKHTKFTNDKEIEEEYYPESIELFKKLTGASRVVIFDHTIRRRRPGEVDDNPHKRQPLALVHVDQTEGSSIARVHRHLPARDIINLWRPISHPAVDWPLAVCDFRSLDMKEDLLPVALIYPDREGETYGVKYSPNQKWMYKSAMDPEDFVLFKCFDSVQDGSVAILTPHTGFEDPKTRKDAPLRESIELRALVFYEN
ncbi:hypothetical protein BKA82DRAFT_13262 [Pisolithus tinctorius]|uniref:Methyltransferase n=1 Tax=Pisolithus tinctorius Marx 270 TaxID=870435 RepID=A0A0C3KQ25_PISTI|nr:hypothetical protein BKA82DRAFT_13262 [Pisolithus tinctorius]KIO11712.1 hypothetical protein M404DRAFT_13262 [Pisolithus tinctorius Marx 270]